MPNYICWTKYRESGVIMEEGEEEHKEFEDDGIIAEYGALHDDTPMGEVGEEVAAQDEPADDLDDAIREAQRECDSEKEKLKFERMLEDHKKLLYPNCDAGQKKLGTTLELLQWKTKNGVFDKGFGELLSIQKKMLPKDNELPSNTYEAKKTVCPM